MDPLCDESWPEVQSINHYAVFMGYLAMGVRGLAMLVLTWTTVVLLGGFVSDLQKEDFWALMVITLALAKLHKNISLPQQQAGAAGQVRGGRPEAFLGQWAGVGNVRVQQLQHLGVEGSEAKRRKSSSGRKMAPASAEGPSPVVLYLLGLYASTAISLWRLIQHEDYGGGGGETKKPALVILYSLAMAQGVVFLHMIVHAWEAKIGMVKSVAHSYELQEDSELVSGYLDASIKGGRNLITYAVDKLMEFDKSRDSYLCGVKILSKVVRLDSMGFHGQQVLAKELLSGSPSLIRHLLETMGPRSPYDRDIREHAARVVAHVAGGIHLDSFPGGVIGCVSALLPEEYEEGGDHWLWEDLERQWLLEECERRRWWLERPGPPVTIDGMVEASKVLVEQGLLILRKLAADEDNCRVMSNAPGLVRKIMAPLTSAKLHGDYHGKWSGIATESMKLVLSLMDASGTGEVRSQISSNVKAITGILDCHECAVPLKRLATATRKQQDESFDTTISSFGWVKKRRCIRRLAGEKLQAAEQSVRGVVSDLGTAIAENDPYMVNAARILGQLWADCSDEYLEQVKQAVFDVMPKHVLREILRRPPARPAADDLENGRDSSRDQQDLERREDIKLKKSLISFCWTIHNTSLWSLRGSSASLQPSGLVWSGDDSFVQGIRRPLLCGKLHSKGGIKVTGDLANSE
ncbi:hypothetical protein GQ55_3G433600 [Panicum hallii var. hallii]|uniref:DUF4220 domain-containing protein n=1 Tax=Panicum hallii var. hallii TaxID=1504633 RepID=A0A2T7EHX6_9POAL|nr:hypothetical protein GQ55_3G433600 [Panicum hallii var. hallii]